MDLTDEDFDHNIGRRPRVDRRTLQVIDESAQGSDKSRGKRENRRDSGKRDSKQAERKERPRKEALQQMHLVQMIEATKSLKKETSIFSLMTLTRPAKKRWSTLISLIRI